MYGLKFGWGFLDSKQKEVVGTMLQIAKSLSDEKIRELGKKSSEEK